MSPSGPSEVSWSLHPWGLALIRIVCEARRARALVRALFLTKSVIFVQIQRAFILLTPAKFHQQSLESVAATGFIIRYGA